MPNLQEFSLEQLKRAVEIKQQIEDLQNELNSFLGSPGAAPKRRGRPPGRPKSTAAVETDAKPVRRRRMSAAGRARIAAAARARWARAKAAGKSRL